MAFHPDRPTGRPTRTNERTNERTKTTFSATSCQVLVADADADTRTLYELALPPAGCQVIQAGDGRDALTKALAEPPALIITELRLPMIDGFALCELLRRDSATHLVPILVVTSETRPTELDRIRKAGATAVLVKPTRPEAIVSEVRNLLAAPVNAVMRQDTSAHVGRLEGHRALAKSHARFWTTTPPTMPPELTCPSCDRALYFDSSYVGGVSNRHAEQWDYFTCSTCGTFQYRQRTRKLRRVQ